MKELVERVRANKVNYKEIILKTLFACTVLSVSLIAPNALKMFSFLKTKEKYQTRHRLKFKTNELIKNGKKDTK
jgi:hypothetical protein